MWSIAEDRLYTVRECAELLGRTTRYVRDQIRSGSLTGFSLNKKGFSHVSGREINQFLKHRCSLAT